MIIELLEKIIKKAINELNYDASSIKVIKSNRPDLCDYQCDGVFKLSKIYNKNPNEVGDNIVSQVHKNLNFSYYIKR